MTFQTRDPEAAQHEDVVHLTARAGSCAMCGYELAGCPIVREPHYGLLILRCPECGHVSTPVPQHLADKLLTRSRRLAFIWWLLFLLVVLAPAAALAGLAQSTGFAVSHPYAIGIASAYHADPAHPPAYHEPSAFCLVREDFTATLDDDLLFRDAGGWSSAPDWVAMTDLLFTPVICLPTAVLWALLIPHRRRGSLLLLAAAAMALGAAGLAVYYSVPTGSGSSEYAYRIAELRFGWIIAASSYVLGGGVFAASLWVARPLARALARWFAPTAILPSLRPLWQEDDLQVPGGTAGA